VFHFVVLILVMKPPVQTQALLKMMASAGQISMQGSLNRGICYFCGEIFILTADHRDPTVCPDCSEIFEQPVREAEAEA